MKNMPRPRKRWFAGRLHEDTTALQFPLAVKHSSIRRLQASFGFCKTTGCLQIQRPRKSLGISLNGVDVPQFSTFVNGTPAVVQLDTLKYRFEYTPFSYTDAYYNARNEEVTGFINFEPWIAAKWEALTQTPSEKSTSIINGWTLRTPVG